MRSLSLELKVDFLIVVACLGAALTGGNFISNASSSQASRCAGVAASVDSSSCLREPSHVASH